MKLWIDDIRVPPGEDWLWAKTSQEAFQFLETEEITEISFDHDLGGEDTTRNIVLLLAETDSFPPICRVHTANIVGRDFLCGIIDYYGPGVTT